MTAVKSRAPPRTTDNQVVEKLKRDGPAVADELPRVPGPRERRYVGKFDVTRSSTGSNRSRGRTQAVYYLYGDERRAVRTYIEENTEFVRTCMQDRANPINMAHEDYWWQMFCEEWTWRETGDPR
ncbi:MAG: hypothetical protein ACLFMT_06670 [Halobacteriales archaeon]